MGLTLANLRIGFECKERWDHMVGDDQVRHCGGCDKQVFNLSAMTRDEAEAVLAKSGKGLCARFYRRPDGTVMTTDCPTGRPQRRKLAVVASGVAASMASTAYADPEPDAPLTVPGEVINVEGNAPIIDQGSTVMGGITMESTMGVIMMPGTSYVTERPVVEWSVFGRVGAGVETKHPDILARGLTMAEPPMDHDSTFEAAIDAEVTVGVARDRSLRIGAYGELRTTTDAVAGGELMVEAEHVIVVRAGAGAHVFTAGLGLGWSDTYERWAHHAFGSRVMTTFNQSTDDPREWSVTFGLEVDPIGVVQKILR